ncbi:MAG: pantetheine-phosphate adenylyltransferase [Coprobacter sp.]
MKTSLNKRIAIFPGTFDPFTIGHMSLVERALNMLDEIVIAIGVNEAKSQYFSVDERVRMLEDLFRSNPRVKVLSYNCLTVDLARLCHAGFILRGIRSVNDFEYEKTIADVNRKISGVETLVLFTEPEHTHISSTIVRELLRYGRSVDEFLPDGLVLSR